MIFVIVSNGLKFDSLHHRAAFASGRARHNLKRARQSQTRQAQLVEVISSGRIKASKTGDLANHLGVSRWTVWRDMKVIEAQGRCLHCGNLLLPPAD